MVNNYEDMEKDEMVNELNRLYDIEKEYKKLKKKSLDLTPFIELYTKWEEKYSEEVPYFKAEEILIPFKKLLL